MATGLKDSPQVQANRLPLAPLAQSQPRPAVNVRIQIKFADSKALQLPGFRVPFGVQVSLRGVNGSAVNAHPVYATDHHDLIGTADVQTISPDTEVFYPVDDTSQIWVSGTAGDGLLITLRGGAIG